MRRRRLAAAAIAGVVLVGGGSVAYAQTQSGAGSYRTATVTTGDVDETMGLSGIITASDRQDLSFGAGGTVEKVSVEAGDVVRSGSTLATLDSTDLETAVTKAEATLAKAKAQLETDKASQATTVTDSETPTAATPAKSTPTQSTPTSSTPTQSPALREALGRLATQQGAVTSAQSAATEAISASKSALAAQVEACKAAETEEPAPADGEDEGEATGLSQECSDALDAVQAAQDVVADQQDTLQTALEALSTTLTAAVEAVGESSSTRSTPSTPSAPDDADATPTTPTTPSTSGSTPSGSAGGPTVTAATLAQDQASIDTAEAQLTEAERQLKSAELTAPFAGEILSVSVVEGDVVADSDVVIVIKGDGATTVTTTVTLDQIQDVAVGQTASVTPAGAVEATGGTVSSIGLLPDASSGTSTYPVTIELAEPVAAPEGSTASISVVTGRAESVLTVPSSAVSTTIRTTVSVLVDGRPVVTPVTVGVVGATRTEITDGLTRGQEIVLADLDADLPSGDSTTTSLTGGGFPRGPGGRG
ncbi:HlyD family efflux transporter periplasmic adaptor subunit [Aeromicrobium fastidiosum]|uniref:HlyD family efflux transporter periplasmic adaptor subunit n=1 Tax=Aeromicrobium fastidiosum TaxID=52699 RepID=UPI00202364ED|nr:HlyD family efflux transporter periplasmic adaptor subunit [Aeromicrobium fastidiosum]MCL8251615.1 HlyD family efflux transporter periplasmic adaptor subunit [Aeromicrobium fastidiosum]